MSKVSHTSLAYLALLLGLLAIAKLTFLPFESRWREHRENTRALELELRGLQQQRADHGSAQAELESSLQEFVSTGKLNSAANASQAALALQTLVKKALQTQSASIQQLRPGTVNETHAFWQSRLEINFSLPAENIDGLFNQLSAYPNMHIELLSLREQTLTQSLANHSKFLEANMAVTMWFVSDALKALRSGISKLPDTAALVEPNEAVENGLAGLFDARHRARWQAPSAEYYRLAAVTVSDNAKVALIADVGTNKTRRLTLGQTLDAWTISAISASQVELTLGQRSETLRLKKQSLRRKPGR